MVLCFFFLMGELEAVERRPGCDGLPLIFFAPVSVPGLQTLRALSLMVSPLDSGRERIVRGLHVIVKALRPVVHAW